MKKMLAAVLVLMILSVSAAGMAWHTKHYCIVDFRVYSREATELDLRGEEISLSHYRKLRRKLPRCQILWDIPFQGTVWPQDTRELTVTTLSRADVDSLTCFPNLQRVDATGCTDYDQLLQLQEACPEVTVSYTVAIGERSYAQDAQTVSVDGITQEELELLSYLPRLSRVGLESGKNPEVLTKLVSQCRERDITVGVVLNGKFLDESTKNLTATNLSEEALPLLRYLPELKTVPLKNPQAKAESLYAMMEDCPQVKITWEKEILGTLFPSDAKVIDLTAALSPAGAAAYAQAATAPIHGDRDEETYLFAIREKYPLPDLTAQTAQIISQVEQALAYYPNVEKVLLCGSILDNEAMAAFRERHREDYQVVWTVQCGKMAARTDTPYFMPTKFHVYYFNDVDSPNLRYCEDIVSLDLGHMSIKSIDFVRYMPKLQYLVLAHTDVRSIAPISSCKELKFLEVDWSAVQDYTPLKECTALEDLNLGNTNRDFTPIGEMTWLKNLWMVGCNSGAAYRMTQALPNTKIVASGSATVANGWRELPNYYAMRDCMNMYYMEW